MQFKNVWFRSDEANWGSFRAYEDVGTLTIEGAALQFDGKKQSVPISNVRSVARKRVGRDFINSWIHVQYEADGEIRNAYFVDGGLLGWSGILGGNKRILEALQRQFQPPEGALEAEAPELEAAPEAEAEPEAEAAAAKCYLCSRDLKPRSYFAGKKIGGGWMMGSDLEKQLEEAMSGTYKCRGCGKLRCRACAQEGPACSCGGRVFDSV